MPVHPLVGFYFARKTLSKLGYTFEANDLDGFEAEAYLIIAGKITHLMDLDSKKKR